MVANGHIRNATTHDTFVAYTSKRKDKKENAKRNMNICPERGFNQRKKVHM